MSQTLIGTDQNDTLTGSDQTDTLTGLAGDDTLTGGNGGDLLVGDVQNQSLIEDTDGALSFSQYGQNDAWSVNTTADGTQEMSQTVDTLAGTSYTLSFEAASNVGAGTLSGHIEVLWNGEVIDSFDTNSGTFDAHQVSLQGTGGPGVLTFRASESETTSGPIIHDDGPILSYDRTVTVAGEEIEVRAVAEGQPYIYQIIKRHDARL